MKFISHRGNTTHPQLESLQNDTQIIEEAIKTGLDVEIDMWKVGHNFCPGHDKPERHIKEEWLRTNAHHLLIHAKNRDMLDWLVRHNDKFTNCPFHFFWHEKDTYTMTNRGVPIVYPGQEPVDGSILMMPELGGWNLNSAIRHNLYGICSDHIKQIRNEWLK